MIAIIAGTGTLPLEACKALLATKKDFFVITLFTEDNFEKIKQSVPETISVIAQPFYKVKTILQLLQEQNRLCLSTFCLCLVYEFSKGDKGSRRRPPKKTCQ